MLIKYDYLPPTSALTALTTSPGIATFLLGDRYITAMNRLSTSENAKIVILPGDVVSAVKALVGGK